MPSSKNPTVPGLGNVRNFVSVLREISFDEVREQAESFPQLLVLAPTAAEARELGLSITGGVGELAITARELANPTLELDRFDAIVVRDPSQSGVARLLRDRQLTTQDISNVLTHDVPDPSDPAQLELLRLNILRVNPDRAPAFGRSFRVFRAAATKIVINETAIANAQFALISNIPALLPIVGGLASASADFLVLTKNQVMMMYKLGAIYDRDLSDQFAIIQELVPVVGAGFLWRSVARGAALFLPLAAGTIPKVGVAYMGTMLVGYGADHYYRTNMRPSKQQLQQFRRQANELLRRLPLMRNLPGASDSEAIETEGRIKMSTAAPENLRFLRADTTPPPDSTQSGAQ